MVRQLIASPLLLTRSPLTKSVFSSLHIRGAGVQVDDALLRMGWDEADPAIAVVISVDHISTNVKGVRFESRGALPEVVKFKANDLWSGAEKGVEVSLKFEDLSVIRWATEGDVRYLKAWLQDKDVTVTLKKGEAEIQETRRPSTASATSSSGSPPSLFRWTSPSCTRASSPTRRQPSKTS